MSCAKYLERQFINRLMYSTWISCNIPSSSRDWTSSINVASSGKHGRQSTCSSLSSKSFAVVVSVAGHAYHRCQWGPRCDAGGGGGGELL